MELPFRRIPIDRWSPSLVLHQLDLLNLIDEAAYQWLIQHRSQMQVPLQHIARQGCGYEVLSASVALLYLEDAIGVDGIVACLRSTDRSLQIATVTLLPPVLIFEDGTPPRSLPLPRSQEIWAALEPLFDHSDYWLSRLAVTLAMRLCLPEADACIVRMLHHAYLPTQLEVVVWLASQGRDEGALDLLAAIVLSSDRKAYELSHLSMIALKSWVQGSERALSHRAAQVLIQYVTRHLETSDPKIENNIDRALRALAVIQSPEQQQLFDRVARSPLPEWVRRTTQQ